MNKKGTNTNKKTPLQWTSFSQKMPENEELIIIAEKYYDSIYYVIGMKCEKNTIRCCIGGICLSQDKKTGEIKHSLNISLDENDKYIQVGPKEWLKANDDYQIKMNLWHWISVIDILKCIQNKPIEQLKIGMDIVEIIKFPQNQFDEKLPLTIRVGKIKSTNNQDIKIENRYFVNDDKSHCQFSFNKDFIVGWTELPRLFIKTKRKISIHCLLPGDFFVDDDTLYSVGEVHSRTDPFRDCFDVNKKIMKRFQLETEVKVVKGLELYHLLIKDIP